MSDFTIIEHNTIDSTNNYAMLLIDANKAQHGLTITAQSQEGGKGQRGKIWIDSPGESLLMSIIVNPKQAIREQFAFNAAVSVAIAKVLQNAYKNWNIRIKWPNDIIINDKKAGGVLIENVLRGNQWAYSIIGIGMNIKQEHMPPELPSATSLKIASGIDFDIRQLTTDIHDAIMYMVNYPASGPASMKLYNEYLYKRGCRQVFRDNKYTWVATIVDAHADGTLELRYEDGSVTYLHHGQVQWVWE
ncbi:MAG: biotin--[acetyl-CoA-carboxylase] ligase [Flavipsychrobacter sp.]|nr:biotin--[acetyl-CoA-carboxylase] ligase [Flavipsychrobacter sp.]